MNVFLEYAFLFFIGSVSGWGAEVLFRRFLSRANPERKWINPGFCTGPYLPLYGFGLCLMYFIASLEKLNFIRNPLWNRVLILAVISVCMTLIEYIAGILALKIVKVRLWDYTGEWGNIQGIICPKFSLIWAAAGAVYYFLIHPHILGSIGWLSKNLAFSFVIGLFFGVFLIDVAQSVNLVAKLREFADEYDVVIKYESLKAHIRKHHEETAQKYHFFRPLHTDRPIPEHLKEMRDHFEQLVRKKKNAQKK